MLSSRDNFDMEWINLTYRFAASMRFAILILLAAILSSALFESTDGPVSSSSPLELIFATEKL